MGNSTSEWWLGADRLWRKGRPPPGWEQGDDGRWHPPAPSPSEAPTERLPVVDPAARRARLPKHGGSTSRSTGRATVDDGPSGWLRVAIPAAAAVVVLSLIGIAVAATGGSGGPELDQAAAGAASTTDGTGATTTSTRGGPTSSSTPGGAPGGDPSTTSSTTAPPPPTTVTTEPPSTTAPTTTTTEPDRCRDDPDTPGGRPPCCRPDHPRHCD